MAVSFYLPKDLKQVLEKTVENNNTTSPNYLSEVNLSPSVLGRNLVKVGETSNLPLDFIPLKMPSEHSSGNILNSRSFDYDIVVANDYDVGDQSVIILDIGITSFKMSYLNSEKDENEGIEETSFIFKVDESIDLDTYNIWNLQKNFKFTSVLSAKKKLLGSNVGLIEVGCLEEIDLKDENLYTYFNIENKTFTISTKKLVTEQLLDSIKSIDLAVSYGNSESYSNLRVAGKVLYQSSVRSFFPASTVVESIPNMRDYLVNKKVESYLGYTVVLKEGEGVLLNLEVGTTNSEEISFFEQPTLFGYSSLRVYYDISELLIGSSAFVKTLGNFTSFEIKETSSNNSIAKIGEGTLESTVDFFENYGIIARFETNTNGITSALLRRIDSKSLASITVDFESTSNIEIPGDIDLETVQFKELPGDNLKPLFTTEGTSDPTNTSKFSVELSEPSKSSSIRKDLNSVSIFSQKDTKVSYAIVNNLNYSSYKDTSTSTFIKTSGKNIITDYGFEQNIEKLASDLVDKVGVVVTPSLQEGCLKIAAPSDLKLFISARTRGSNGVYDLDSFEEADTLKTIESSSIQSKSEAIVYIKKGSPKYSENISTLGISLENLSQLNIQPYCYNVLGEKFDEQTSYIYSFVKPSISDLYNTSLPFFTFIIPTNNHVNSVVLLPKSTTIEGYVMKNLLVWTDEDKNGLKELNNKSADFSVSTFKGEVTSGSLPSISNSSLSVAGRYVTLNTKGLQGSIYNPFTSVRLSPNTSFKITIANVEDLLEVVTVQVHSDLQVTITGASTLSNIETISEESIKLLKISSKGSVLKVTIEGSITIYDSGIFYKQGEVTYIMLEGSA